MSGTQDAYTYFMQVTKDVILGNIFTLATHNDTLDIITNTSLKLTDSWTSGPASAEIEDALKKIHDGKGIDDFIQEWLGSGKGNVADFSQKTTTQILNLLAKYYDSIPDKDHRGSLDTTIVNSFASVVEATMNNATQGPQNLSKTEGSVIQQDAGAQQPIADIGTNILQVLSNIASLIQQIYSG